MDTPAYLESLKANRQRLLEKKATAEAAGDRLQVQKCTVHLAGVEKAIAKMAPAPPGKPAAP